MNFLRIQTGGYLMVLLLVYGSVFFIILTAFFASIVTQWQQTQRVYESEKALHLAEAGMEYYRWYLAHHQGDTTHGTGVPGPFTREFSDPEGGVIGEYELMVTGNTMCGEVTTVDIVSTGRPLGSTQTRTVYGRYAQPTVAEFSYVINSNVWAGPDRVITGPYHSNGYIRMDGTNQSIVTSQQDRWDCDDSELTCVGAEYMGTTATSGDNINAIYGSGSGHALWSNPASRIDFGELLNDLASMRTFAENEGGLFIDSTGAGEYGYRVHFNGDDTITVSVVNGAITHREYASATGAWYDAERIVATTTATTTYAIPTDCPVIFIADNVWLSGEVDQKVTLAAGLPTSETVNPTIVLQDSIIYTNPEAGLLAVAEQDVLLGVNVPNDLELNGIFMAQKGHFGRNHYRSTGANRLPDDYHDYVMRNSVSINGTVVSSGRVGSQWVSGGTPTSGFLNRTSTYDRALVEDPPPLTPITSETYRFIQWQEL